MSTDTIRNAVDEAMNKATEYADFKNEDVTVEEVRAAILRALSALEEE